PSAVLGSGGGRAMSTAPTPTGAAQVVALEGSEVRPVVEIPLIVPRGRPTGVSRHAGGDPPADQHYEIHEIPPANQYGIQAELFARSIREDTPVPVEPTDAIANMEVLDRIFAAS